MFIFKGSEEHNRDIRFSRNHEPVQSQVLSQNRGKALTEHTLEDICEVLNSEIEGLDRLRVAEYHTNLRSQNINGRVLALCDMEELKCYLNMTFGDWNLFKQWVYTKRMIDTEEGETSVTSRSLNEEEASPGVTITAPPAEVSSTNHPLLVSKTIKSNKSSPYFSGIIVQFKIMSNRVLFTEIAPSSM